MPQSLPIQRTSAIDAPTPLRLWHLTSLDAPTVALVWSIAFAWATHVRLPPWVPALLALAVWALYIADRLLDARTALRNQTLHHLRDRHLFHWRHRRILLPLAVTAAAASAYIIINFMPVIARERNSILAAASLAYFTRVHTGRRHSPFISKELLVGLLFTAGCALPAFSRATFNALNPIWPLLIPAIFFALLAWLNCHAIDRWESQPRIPTEEISIKIKRTDIAVCDRKIPERHEVSGHDLSRANVAKGIDRALAPEGSSQNIPSHNRIFPIATLFALTALILAAILHTQPRTSVLLLAAALAAFLLALLDKLRGNLTPIALRAAADLVLLTPILLIPVAPLLK